MLEFLFGLITGVWMGQQLPLPSVQEYVKRFWDAKTSTAIAAQDESKTEEQEDTVPLFSGQMPAV